MSEDSQARIESVPSINETILPASIFQGLVRTLKCMAAIGGPAIKIEDKIVSTSFRGGIAIADMTGLKFSTVPMTIYRDEKAIKELDRLVGGKPVRIYFRETDETYYADNGHLEQQVGRKCPEIIQHPIIQKFAFLGYPIAGLKPSMITKHIGNATGIVLGVHAGQLEHILSGTGNLLRLNPAIAGVPKEDGPDLRLMVSRSLLALRENLNSITMQVGKLDDDHFIELKANLGYKMHLLVREKAVVL